MEHAFKKKKKTPVATRNTPPFEGSSYVSWRLRASAHCDCGTSKMEFDVAVSLILDNLWCHLWKHHYRYILILKKL
jgi:hypothetical protein